VWALFKLPFPAMRILRWFLGFCKNVLTPAFIDVDMPFHVRGEKCIGKFNCKTWREDRYLN
jgi:hypothetical protein